MTTETAELCPACAGCGRVANDDDSTPWCYWEELPLKSSLAVLIGAVRPIVCAACSGSGKLTRVTEGDPR